jgi:putative ABC transport system permease protein
MRLVRLLNVRFALRRPLRTALAAVAIAAGVSLPVAVAAAAHGISASLARVGHQTGGSARLRVAGPTNHGGLDSELADRIQATPGIAAAVPVIQTVALATSSQGRARPVVVLGVDCRIEALVGAFGCPRADIESAADTTPPLVGAALARQLGSGAHILTDENQMPLGMPVPQLDRINRGEVAVFPLHEAQRLYLRPDRVDTIYVLPEPGGNMNVLRARLAAVVGPVNRIVPASQSLMPVETFLKPFLGLLVLVGLAALGVGGVLVHNTTELTLQEQRRELAIVGALGARPTVIVRGTLIATALLGATAGLVGSGLGILVARPVLGNTSTIVRGLSGIRVSVRPSLFLIGLGLLLGVFSAVAAAIGPSVRATRLDLAAELHRRGGHQELPPIQRAWHAGLVTAISMVGLGLSWLAGLGGSLRSWQPIAAQLGIVIAALGLVVAIAMWAPLATAWFARPFRRRTTGSTAVAAIDLFRQPAKVAAIASALGAAVGLAAGLGHIVPGIRGGIANSYGRLAAGRVYVSNYSVNFNIPESKTSASTVAALRQLPGVADVAADYNTLVFPSRHSYAALTAYEGRDNVFTTIKGKPLSQALASDEAMIGPAFARSRHLRPGSPFQLPAPGRMVTLRVGGIWSSPEYLGYSVTISPQKLLTLWGPQPAPEIWVRPKPGVALGTIAQEIKEANLQPGLLVFTPDQYVSRYAREIGTNIGPFWVLQRLLLLIALVAAASTLLLIGYEKRREHGILAAVGMSPGGLVRTTVLQSLAVAVTGAGLGLIASVGLGFAFLFTSGILFGLRPPVGLNFTLGFVYAGLGVLVIVAGAVWPAWRTGKLDVTDALRYE